MKTKLYLLIAATFVGINLFAQTKTLKPLTSKTVAPVPTGTTLEHPQAVKPQTKPAPTPTDLQNAVVNIVVGDDGKDKDTYVSVEIYDDNQRPAAYYGVIRGTGFAGMTSGEYFPGDDETLSTKLDPSEPTGEIDNSKIPPLPVVREANVSDFSNGGSVIINIVPNGHDTWKINSFTVTLYFNNDPGSPHRITWNGFTLSQDSRWRTLQFDKNFNAIQ
jgi:hypothetical protein